MAKKAPSSEAPDVALVLFGLDDAGKAHASRFAPADAELAAKAAALMGMHTLPVTTDEHHAAALPLPQGRVFGSGRAFVPFVARATYERLCALAGLSPGEQVNGRKRAPKRGAVGPASAATTPAMPMAAKSGDGVSEPDESDAEGAEPVPGDVALEDDHERPLPTEWKAVAVGDLVLAPEVDRMSWWPALVLQAKGDDRWVLKWRDFDDPPSFVRHHSEIGLLNPATTLR